MPRSNASTILDVDHPRSRALQQRVIHLNALWDRLDPQQNDELQELHRDVQARMVTLLANGLNRDDHEDLERQCGLYGAYLHDEATRAGLEEIRTVVQQSVGELREWADVRVNLHRDFIDGLRDRMTDVAQRLNSLTDPDTGTIRRFRRNIRDLQEQMAALRDENEGFHALRDEMATMRRDIDELRQQAGARPLEGEILPQNQAPPMGHQDPVPPPQDPAPPMRHPSPGQVPVATPRRLLEIQQPSAFSGGSNKIPFDTWWEEVRQYLKAQPADVIGSAERKIVWASGLLQDDAKSWYWDWVKRANEGEVQYNWETFENDLVDRFQEDEQDVRALRNLEKLSYKEGDSIHSFLAKWDALSLKARVKDVVYRQMLLGAMPRAVIERLQLKEPAKDDRGFRDQVLRAGKTSEHWHHHRLADRPRTTTSRPEPSRSNPVRNSGPPRNLGPSRGGPLATTGEKRYPQLFATMEDATKGIPQHVVRWRMEQGHCARCGWSTPIGKHLATHCTRETNSRLPQPPQNVAAGHRVAAIELGKRERPIELDEFDDGWKRPRAEDSIAWEPELPPLYANLNEVASDSEEKFED
jgi:hypothetical protein